ncbi:MAG TPA: stage III sporulation protein AH [Lachnoclostridium phytofermentans]|uniref:Stage III sporulation protein AH n=1 Tax=Lachnoclostridium phytofermentans TaxID=66219 RepID=A0A3D2X3A2_9FIRM|nr:SpoIIIAH-like family protein [Lachnoclostridium sp.]HCL01629.1 stage III sporulation protein AH [Lachnoclostridium phytofermentans]
MKNIFKKNQIIITALAIMIAVAGYLNFAKDSTKDPAKDVATSTKDTLGYDIFADSDGEEYADIADDQMDQIAVDDKGNLIVDENKTASDANKDATDQLAEKDKDSAQTSNENGTAKDDQGTNPGEAVLVNSNVIDKSFFANAKLKREQTRAKSREDLLALVENPNISAKQKEQAGDRVLELTAISEKENATEIQLDAKGFSDAVVTINEGRVDVVVNAPNLTEQDMAIIEDVVMTKTGVTLDKITIVGAVVVE